MKKPTNNQQIEPVNDDEKQTCSCGGEMQVVGINQQTKAVSWQCIKCRRIRIRHDKRVPARRGRPRKGYETKKL